MGNLRWSDAEFPPLTIRKGDSRSMNHIGVTRLPWSDYGHPFGRRGVPVSPASSMSVNPPTTPASLGSRSHSGIPTASGTSSNSPHDLAITNTPHSTSATAIIEMSPDQSTVPRTPKSAQVPIPASLHGSEARSRSYESDFLCGPERADIPGGPSPLPSLSHAWVSNDRPRVDPTAIFVGGLDVYSDDVWDESHLNAIFAKYGRIENIQIVRPGKASLCVRRTRHLTCDRAASKKSAFAFVKFSDAEAAANAVQEEVCLPCSIFSLL